MIRRELEYFFGAIRFFTRLPVPHWVERGQFTPGNSVPRFHIVWGTGRELALRLIDRLQAHAGLRFAVEPA